MQEAGDLWMGDAVVHMASAPLRNHELVTSDHCQVLREVGSLQFGLGLQFCHRVLLPIGEQFQNPYA